MGCNLQHAIFLPENTCCRSCILFSLSPTWRGQGSSLSQPLQLPRSCEHFVKWWLGELRTINTNVKISNKRLVLHFIRESVWCQFILIFVAQLKKSFIYSVIPFHYHIPLNRREHHPDGSIPTWFVCNLPKQPRQVLVQYLTPCIHRMGSGGEACCTG